MDIVRFLYFYNISNSNNYTSLIKIKNALQNEHFKP
jgi:hypothetical protein